MKAIKYLATEKIDQFNNNNAFNVNVERFHFTRNSNNICALNVTLIVNRRTQSHTPIRSLLSGKEFFFFFCKRSVKTNRRHANSLSLNFLQKKKIGI